MHSGIGKRILIIGSPGAGKSTLSMKLSRITGLELYHMDRLYWLPGWIPVQDDIFVERLRSVLSGESWIIDGNYQNSLQQRIERSDTIIYLDYRRSICLFRSLKRTFISSGQREDITEGCEEKLDIKFLKWIWNYRKKYRKETMDLLDSTTSKRVLVFTSPGKLAVFLSSLEESYPKKTHS